MACATLQYFSRSLAKESSCHVVFPDDPGVPRPWAALYLLHGLSDEHTTWARRTGLERYVEGLPLIVAMPDGGRGWYTDAVEGYAHEGDLMTDVIGLVDRTFPVRAERAGRAIGGLSMGGYGAVKLALKHPETFASAHSHSGALAALRDPERSRGRSPEFPRIFGRRPKDGPEDPFALARRADRGRIPALRLDCGTEDHLLDHSRAFHKHLDDLKIPHEYEEFPGRHDWDYWDLRIREAVAFHRRHLGLGA